MRLKKLRPHAEHAPTRGQILDSFALTREWCTCWSHTWRSAKCQATSSWRWKNTSSTSIRSSKKIQSSEISFSTSSWGILRSTSWRTYLAKSSRVKKYSSLISAASLSISCPLRWRRRSLVPGKRSSTSSSSLTEFTLFWTGMWTPIWTWPWDPDQSAPTHSWASWRRGIRLESSTSSLTNSAPSPRYPKTWFSWPTSRKMTFCALSKTTQSITRSTAFSATTSKSTERPRDWESSASAASSTTMISAGAPS